MALLGIALVEIVHSVLQQVSVWVQKLFNKSFGISVETANNQIALTVYTCAELTPRGHNQGLPYVSPLVATEVTCRPI
jgi:hypothetical protein